MDEEHEYIVEQLKEVARNNEEAIKMIEELRRETLEALGSEEIAAPSKSKGGSILTCPK